MVQQLNMGTGLFITFEGIDGSGKSTQSEMLASKLSAKSHDIVKTREPGGSVGAELIRTLLVSGDTDRWSPETEILLFTAARRDHMEKNHPARIRCRQNRNLRSLRRFNPRLSGRCPRRSTRHRRSIARHHHPERTRYNFRYRC